MSDRDKTSCALFLIGAVLCAIGIVQLWGWAALALAVGAGSIWSSSR